MSYTEKITGTAEEAKKCADEIVDSFKKQAKRMRLLNNLFQILAVLADDVTALAASLD